MDVASSKTIDDQLEAVTLGLEHLRQLLGRLEPDVAGEALAALDAVLVTQAEARASVGGVDLPVGGPADAMPGTDDGDLEVLRAELLRLDDRCRKLIAAQEKTVRQLAVEMRSRVTVVEQRHEALLNGTIFSFLRRIAGIGQAVGLLRGGLRGRQVPGHAPSTAVAGPVPAGRPPAPKPVDQNGLPPHKSVRIAGVPYMSRPKEPLGAPAVTYEGEPLISVVMTCYNTGAYVEQAARSILGQTWRNLELIAVDDCSTDDTRAVLERIANEDPRLQVFCLGVNRGTYWSKNFGITRSRGEVVTFMDSDDISEPGRLAAQFAALNHVGRVVSTCNHVRKDESGTIIEINGVVERVAYISQMVKRPVFDEIGYFDSVRTSADDEFLRRIRRSYGREAEVNVKKPLYVALLRDGSLTSDPDNAINFKQERTEVQSFLSPQRRHYAAMCERWHSFLDEKGLRPYVPFPVVRRPFPAFGKLRIGTGEYEGNFITACLASYPPRRDKLKVVVESILPQVDHLYVYLNEYSKDDVPEFLKHSRITVEVGGADLRDNGKFFFMDRVRDGYVITVDDDLVYPHDYVQTLIRKIEFYDRKVVVGLHGTIYAKPIKSFFAGRTLIHFEEEMKQDTVVNQLGTGTTAFHTSAIRPELAWFRQSGMADVWFAVEARKRRVTLVAIERPVEWLTVQGVEETTLFREFRRNDSVQTDAIRSVAPWKEVLWAPLDGIVADRSARFGKPYSRLAPRLGVTEEERAEIEAHRAALRGSAGGHA